MKILSKMGISLLTSYAGAHNVEAVGLGEEVVDIMFKKNTSQISEMGLKGIASESVMARLEVADAKMKLINYGYYKPVPKMGEYHANSSDLAKLLHNAIGLDKTANLNTRDSKYL